jgi:hypothetical protein
MSFSADIANGEQVAVFAVNPMGKSRKGKDVPLENVRLEVADPADADKVVIGSRDDFTKTVQAADGNTFVGPVALKMLADGHPGEGDVEISDDGIVSIKSPDAASFGTAIAGTVEDIP